jgi:hypothetical protein
MKKYLFGLAFIGSDVILLLTEAITITGRIIM